jgi:hypothetical protein
VAYKVPVLNTSVKEILAFMLIQNAKKATSTSVKCLFSVRTESFFQHKVIKNKTEGNGTPGDDQLPQIK